MTLFLDFLKMLFLLFLIFILYKNDSEFIYFFLTQLEND